MPAVQENGVDAPKTGRRPLRVLINEITACLDSTGEAASTQQPSDSTVLAARMRAVLPMVFAHVDHQNGNTRAVPAVLRMVDLALERFPGLFSPGSRAFCFHLMQKLLSLLTLQPAVEGILAVVCQQLCSMTSMLGRDDPDAYALVFGGALQLSAECHQVMRLMCIPGALPVGTAAHVACFHAGCAAAAAADAAVNASAAPPTAGTAPAPQPLQHCSLVLRSVQHCEAAQVAALRLVAHCMHHAPMAAPEADVQAALSLATEFMRFGGAELVQPAAWAAVAALAASLTTSRLPAVTLLQSALSALDEAAASGRLSGDTPSAAAGWQFDALALLQRCTDALAESGGLGSAAPGMANTLCRAAVAAPSASRLQAELVHLLADVATVFPALVDCCGGCLALLPVGGAVAAALQRLLHAAQTPASAQPQQHLSQELLAQDDSSEAQPEGGSARKRRKLRHSNAQAAAKKAKQAAASQPAAANAPVQPQSGFAADLLQGFEGLQPEVPHAWSNAQCLAALQLVLDSCSSAAWLPRLAASVKCWTSWAATGTEDATSDQEAALAVLGVIDAFAAACVRVTAAAAIEEQPTGLLVTASAFAGLKLSTAQLETILRLPWQRMQTDSEGSQPTAAAQSSLRVGLAAAWLGSADGRPSAGLLRELLADAAAHPAASLQATAALLAPAYMATAASMSAAGLSQVSSQARNEGRKESRKLLATLRSNADASVRLSVAVALQDCLHFDALCQPGLPDLCRVLASARPGGRSAGVDGQRWAIQQQEARQNLVSARVDFRALEDFAAALLTDEPKPDVQAAMLVTLVHHFKAASAASLPAARKLLLACWDLAGRKGIPSVRAVLAGAVHVLVSPHVLAAAFGDGADAADAAATCESALVQRLKGMLERGSSSSESREGLLRVLAAAGARLTSAPAQLLLLAVLVGSLDDGSAALRATVAELLEALAARRGAELHEVVMGTPQLLEWLGRAFITRDGLLDELADLLGMGGQQLVREVLPAAIPALIAAQDRTALEALAQRAGMSLQNLVHEFGHHAVAKHIFEGSQDFGSFMEFIESVIGEGFVAYLRGIMQRVITEIIAIASNAPDWSSGPTMPKAVFDRTRSMLHMLAHDVDADQRQDVADLLADCDHVTKILKLYGDQLDRGCQAASPDEAAHRNILRGVSLLIGLTGRHIDRFLPQMMVLLTGAVRAGKPAAVKLQALEGWYLLVQALLQHAPTQLSGVMHQVMVTLLDPLHEGGSIATAAARVVEAIVVQGGHQFQEQLKRLPPLPASVPALVTANAALSEARGGLLAEDMVVLLRDSLSSDSLGVRAAALQELQSYLQTHRPWLQNLLADSLSGGLEGSATQTQQAALLSSLIAALLKCCDPEVGLPVSRAAQQAAATCLGLLGAVDPARVALPPPPTASLVSADLPLLVDLIQRHLVRVLRVASHLFQLDAATYAIQELLRHYSSAGLPAAPGSEAAGRGGNAAEDNSLFAALPENIQAIVRPYLDSKFAVQGAGSSRKGIIFGTAGADLPFRRWLFQWLKQLVSQAAGSRLKMFQACIPIFRVDIQVSQFLLPYLVQNVVSHSSDEARQGVLNEMEAVLRGGQSSREGELCVQAVFTLLDTLRTWLAEQRCIASSSASGTTASGSTAGGAAAGAAAAPEDPAIKHMADLLDGIPQELLASAAAHCGAHARALLHYETHVRAARGGGLNAAALRHAKYADDEVLFLQEVYGKLEEPDGLAGLVRLRQGGATPADHMLAAQKAGAWSEALSLHEQALQHDAAEPQPQSGTQGSSVDTSADSLSTGQRGYLRCLLHMGHLHSQLSHVNGWAVSASDGAKCQLAAAGVAAAWRLGQWDALPQYVACADAGYERLEPEDRWEVRMGRLLSGVAGRDAAAVDAQLEAARDEIMAPLSAAAMESYARAYPHLIRLHMLQEASDAATLLQDMPDAGAHERERRLQWGPRLAVTQAGLPARGPILALRRQLASLANVPDDAGAAWLQHAKLSRAAGHFEAANTASLEAMAQGVPGAPLEHAKLLWAMSKPHRAIIEMQQVIEQHETAAGSNDPAARLLGFATAALRRRHEAKARVLLANWLAETGQGYQGDIQNLFARAVDLAGATEEKPHFYYAKFLDKLMSDARQRQSTTKATAKDLDRIGGRSKIELGADKPYIEWLPNVLESYASSIRLGHRHIYKSLPRLLTLWYDFGTQALASRDQKMKGIAAEVHKTMAGLGKKLPMYVWLVSLPQLCSRLTHPHPETSNLTCNIITRVFMAYPQQALWQLAAVAKSTVARRKAAAAEVLAAAKKHCKDDHTRALIKDFTGLCDQLVKLCHHQPKDKNARFTQFSVRKDFATLQRMMPMRIMVPIQATLTPTIPPAPLSDEEHSPFSHLVQIQGIFDTVDVISSLQRPKKIKFIGSDGNLYLFLAKPKDDLRKDARMMEMMGVLNRLLAKHPASRRRNLFVRRFAVTPLTEDCGILEWVQKTGTLRHSVQRVYVQEGLFHNRTNQVIQRLYDTHAAAHPKNKRRTELLDKVLGMLPPRMHRWFLERWAEPAAWHAARLAFTRTAAVMSMVGHICGLGDRHGENILLHSETGEVMHVDFSCLFDRGLTLEKPEMVPFRLTQNMIDGFGVSGHEGVFRRCCEITLEVLRADRETLLSVLETFVHDPLVDWTRSHRPDAAEADNPHAKDALATIEGRLRGTVIGVSSTPSPPLSVEGQAHRLIDEAVCKERLGLMYIWWMPWM